MPPKRERRRKREVDARAASREALLKVLEPLAGFAFDAGLSIQDVCALFRVAAVQSVAAQQREAGKRINISGIAASTGIPRAEVSRILKGPKAADSKPRVQSTHRILAAWRGDPRFTTPNGQPANLKIYGEGATFETLVKEFGRGLPVRAVLDELSRERNVAFADMESVHFELGIKANSTWICALFKPAGQLSVHTDNFLKKSSSPVTVLAVGKNGILLPKESIPNKLNDPIHTSTFARQEGCERQKRKNLSRSR